MHMALHTRLQLLEPPPLRVISRIVPKVSMGARKQHVPTNRLKDRCCSVRSFRESFV